MKIGYYVQGAMDEAFVHGLARRWCPDAELAEGRFRGSSGESFRREIHKSLIDLRDTKGCDVLIVLTDSDVNPWRDVKRREAAKVPAGFQHQCAFGVAERNVECWISIDRDHLASHLKCDAGDIPVDDPSGFVKRSFRMGMRDADRKAARENVSKYVAIARLKVWIDGSPSFADFYDEVRALAALIGCQMPNEREAE